MATGQVGEERGLASNPRTFFPRDQLPRASWDELLDATVGHLGRSIDSADVGAIALVTTLESGSESGLGIQVETRASSLFLVYPYSGTGQRWSLGEPQTAEGLLVGPLLAGWRGAGLRSGPCWSMR